MRSDGIIPVLVQVRRMAKEARGFKVLGSAA